MLFNAGHAATAALAIVGTVVALRGPWTGTTAAAASHPQPQAAPQVVYVDQYGRPLATVTPTAAPGFAPSAMPASYLAPAPMTRVVSQPVVYEPAPQPAVRYAPRPAVVRSAPTRVVRTQPEGRSWKTRALVIGGSAGAGAGVGALIAGKKGAGIGAAIGGGTAALIEAFKK